MKISSQTKISKIIKHNIEAIEVIASINSNFKKLRNPILRTVLAPRVTISDASRIGKCDIRLIFEGLQKIGFELETTTPTSIDTSCEKNKPTSQNQFLNNRELVKFDIRPVLEKNEDPFNSIMLIVNKLNNSNALEITSPFEPIPLIRIVEKKGFETLTIEIDKLYKLYIKKDTQTPSRTQNEDTFSSSGIQPILSKFKGKIKEIDVRNLEMPLPFVTILDELRTLNEEHALFVHHKRVPQFLLPEIGEMGFTYHVFEIDHENVELVIHRK